MSIEPSDRQHFTRAVTEFGEKRSVVTTRAIYNNQGAKIIEAGVAVNASLYERLMQHQLDQPLQDSVGSTFTVTSQSLRDSAARQIETFPFFNGMSLDKDTQALLLDIVSRIPLPEPIAFQLTLAHDVMPELYEHLVLSSVVAAWLAMDARVSRLRMAAAAAAGLLHDIGLLHLDPVLQNYRKNIDAGQQRQLYSHPLVSALLIEPHPEYGAEVSRGVREHHEFLDASGYPAGLGDDQIGTLGRILALTELIVGSFAPGRSAAVPRLSVQLRLNTHRYDEGLIRKVLGALHPQWEAAAGDIDLLESPVDSLLAIDAALSAWPAGTGVAADMSGQQVQLLQHLGAQIAQLHRMLARGGVTPEQLGQLGATSPDAALQAELTLLAREASWQLGRLALEIRRHMGAHAGRQCPAEFKDWVDRVDRIAKEIAGATTVSLADAHPQPDAAA